MIADADLRELEQLCLSAKEFTEFDKTYILLSQLRLPEGCTPAVVDALLCLSTRDGYTTRLYFSQQVSCKNSLNGNAPNVPILQRNWFACSWRDVAAGRAIEILAQHLRAFR